MVLLLDTHALLWYAENNPQLSANARSLIDNPENTALVSMASFYEIAIKMNIGKLVLGKSLAVFYGETIANQIQVLPIAEGHLSAYIGLPVFQNHKDPFDRLIIATAITENATLLSADTSLAAYNSLVTIIW